MRRTSGDTGRPELADESVLKRQRQNVRHAPDLAARAKLLNRVESGLFTNQMRPSDPVLKSRYRLSSLLGRGGMGVVYSAEDIVLEREVAIKFVRAGSALDARDLLREAKTLARLAHPNVVPVYDVGEYDPEDLRELGLEEDSEGFQPTFVVMERVRGQTLTQWLAKEKPTRADVIRVFRQAAEGLACGHAVRVVHRDFKPSNVMVSETGRARVLDFGLARRLGESQSFVRGFENSAAAGGIVVVGTPEYMSPEQHAGDDGDARSDQYSFCVALYEALTNTRVFQGLELEEIARKKQAGPLVAPSSAGLPRHIRRLIRRGTAPEPDDRFPSMETLVAVLQPSRRKHWLLFGGASFLVGTVVAASMPKAAVRNCDLEAEAAIETVWDSATRDRVQNAFSQSGLPYSDKSWLQTTASLDEFAKKWTERRSHSCQVESANENADAGTACLESQLDYVAALVGVLETGEDSIVASAAPIMESLPDMNDCSSARRKPTYRTEDSTVAIARARAFASAGDSARARELVSTELEQHTREPSPSSALLHLTRATIALRAGETEAAERDALKAWTIAERSGDGQLASRAMLTLVSVRRTQARYADAEALLGVLEARASATTAAPILRARVLTEAAHLAWARNDYSLAVSMFDTAREAWIESVGPDAEHLVTVRSTRAKAVARLGDTDTAIALLEALRADEYERRGKDHPSLARIDLNLASVYRLANKPGLALGYLRRAVAVFARSRHARLDRADALQQASTLAISLGHTLDAEQLARQLIAEERQRLGENHPQIIDAFANLAFSQNMRGRPGAALETLGSAQAALESLPEATPELEGLVHILLCEAHIQEHAVEAALGACRSAVLAWNAVQQQQLNVGVAHLMYALALTDADRTTEALVEVEAAREVLDRADLPTLEVALARVIEGQFWLRSDDLDIATRRLEEAHSLLEKGRDRAPVQWVTLQLWRAVIDSMSGEVERALRHAEECTNFTEKHGVTTTDAAACTALYATLLEERDAARTSVYADRADALWSKLETEEYVRAEYDRWLASAKRAPR